MIIIKCYGVDPYVTGNYSKKYIPLVRSRFNIVDEFVVIAPDEYIFHDGVEQTSWQAIIEVIISPTYKPIEKDLAHALISYFSEEVVNIRLYFNYIDSKSFYTLENKDYPPFVVDKDGANLEEVEPHTEDMFGDFESRVRESGHEVEDEEPHPHTHDHADDDTFN